MEGKLRILSESKLTAIISFTCESNIWYGGYSQISSSQTLDKHTLKRRFRQSYFKCSILVNPNHTSKDAPCVLGTVEKQPSEMTQPLSDASPQTSQVGLFVSGLSFVFLGILSFFSALPFQNIRKFLANFTPSSNGLNISTKHTCISICSW